jgi:hypothetical protein
MLWEWTRLLKRLQIVMLTMLSRSGCELRPTVVEVASSEKKIQSSTFDLGFNPNRVPTPLMLDDGSSNEWSTWKISLVPYNVSYGIHYFASSKLQWCMDFIRFQCFSLNVAKCDQVRTGLMHLFLHCHVIQFSCWIASLLALESTVLLQKKICWLRWLL